MHIQYIYDLHIQYLDVPQKATVLVQCNTDVHFTITFLLFIHFGIHTFKSFSHAMVLLVNSILETDCVRKGYTLKEVHHE